MVERALWEREAARSNRVTPTNIDILKIEQDESINPTLDTLKKIAKALGVSKELKIISEACKFRRASQSKNKFLS